MENKIKESKIEIEFYKTLDKVQGRIQKHLNNAEKQISKATELAEKYGIYFDGVSNLQQKYVAYSFKEKWENKLKEELKEEGYQKFLYENDLTRYGNYLIIGWEHSDIC